MAALTAAATSAAPSMLAIAHLLCTRGAYTLLEPKLGSRTPVWQIGFARNTNLVVAMCCFQSGPNLALTIWREFSQSGSWASSPSACASALRVRGLRIYCVFAVTCQIVSFARLPDWLCFQIGQIVGLARLCQIGRFTRLSFGGSGQID